jgi:hypothetical protein
MLSNTAESLEIGDLPVVPANMRSTYNYSTMKNATQRIQLYIGLWKPTPGSGATLAYRLWRVNMAPLVAQSLLAATSAVLYYAPSFFLSMLLTYLEDDPDRENRGWGWVWVFSLFVANVISYLGKFLSVFDRRHLKFLQSLGNYGHYLRQPYKFDYETS